MPGNESTRFFSKFERLNHLISILNSGRGYSTEQLAEMLETDKRTVQRYLKNEVLKLLELDRLDESKHGHKTIYTVPEQKRKVSMVFGLGDAIAGKMALEVFRPFEGTPLHGYIEHVLKSINESLSKANFQKTEELNRKLVGHAAFKRKFTGKSNIIDDIMSCLLYNEWLEITYERAGEKPRKFKVAPYSLVAYKNGLYLLAMNESAVGWGDPSTYAVERIKKCNRLTGQKFEYPKDYDPSDHLPESGGIIGCEEEEVEIEFSPKLEAYLKNIIWPSGTKITRTKSGKVLLRSCLNLSPETLHFIIGFGPDARVLKPETLKTQIVEFMKNTLSGYNQE